MEWAVEQAPPLSTMSTHGRCLHRRFTCGLTFIGSPQRSSGKRSPGESSTMIRGSLPKFGGRVGKARRHFHLFLYPTMLLRNEDMRERERDGDKETVTNGDGAEG